MYNILNRELKSHIIFLKETKIDSSSPCTQFQLQGYRKDRAKGGGVLMAYFSSKRNSWQMKLPKQYKIIAIHTMINNNDVLFVGIYRPPKVTGPNYHSKLEKELNSICMWATTESKTVILKWQWIKLMRNQADRLLCFHWLKCKNRNGISIRSVVLKSILNCLL